MLVKFISSETGVIWMLADSARAVLETIGRPCTAEGILTSEAMPAAIEKLRHAIEKAKIREREATKISTENTMKNKVPDTADDKTDENTIVSVGFSQRAWPLLDALEHTIKKGTSAHIRWEAAADF